MLRPERPDWPSLMFPSQEERARFCLALDYSRKTSSKSSPSGLFLRSAAGRVSLLTSSLQWRPASGRRLQFLGRHFYLLQTEHRAHRAVRSLRAAEFFIK